MKTPSPTRRLALILAMGLSAAGAVQGAAQAQGMHGRAAHGGMMHDEATMPGLRGANATAEESAELAVMFRNFRTITRSVENLPNGIRTVTRSSDPAVMDVLVSHATGMIDRVARKDDPAVIIQSPTLDVFFMSGDRIVSEIEVTDEGLVVVQTSEDPVLVEALQVHAAEVSAMAERGMAAVHEMMMKQGRGH